MLDDGELARGLLWPSNMPSKHVNTGRDFREGVLGALGILVDLGTPFLRGVRSRWGLAVEETARAYPGDELVPKPSWSWTHGIEIAAPAERVWPWVVQLGQDKAGLYSYQWLENLAGCDIQNGAVINPAWQQLAVGDAFRLHPKVPPLQVAALQPGRWFVVTNEMDLAGLGSAPATAGSDPTSSWLFFVEPLSESRSRFISRFRIDHGVGFRNRLSYGPWLTESIGFVMDRAMLRGVKRRAETVFG